MIPGVKQQDVEQILIWASLQESEAAILRDDLECRNNCRSEIWHQAYGMAIGTHLAFRKLKDEVRKLLNLFHDTND